jgi:hypothetical protein
LRARFIVALPLALVLHAGPAAADSREDARTAYAAASHAFDAGDFETAARELTRADDLVQNDGVLALALDAVVKTELAALGMELAERADRAPSLADKAALVRAKFSERVGRVRAHCPTACEVTANAVHLAPDAARWLPVGHVTVEFRSSGQTRTVDAEVRASSVTEIEMPASLVPPPPPPRPTLTRASGLAPAWFFLGVGLTAVLGAGTIASGVDADALHSRYIASNPRTADMRASGIAAQDRTDVLVAITGVVGLVTLAVGIFATRWRAPRVALQTASLAFTFE